MSFNNHYIYSYTVRLGSSSFGVKCWVEDLAIPSVYSSPFGVIYLGPVPPNWPNASNTLKQELICQMIFTLDNFFNRFFVNQKILVHWQIFLLFNQCACPNWKIDHKARLIAWNAWMEISHKTALDAKFGVEDLTILCLYPSP